MIALDVRFRLGPGPGQELDGSLHQIESSDGPGVAAVTYGAGRIAVPWHDITGGTWANLALRCECRRCLPAGPTRVRWDEPDGEPAREDARGYQEYLAENAEGPEIGPRR